MQLKPLQGLPGSYGGANGEVFKLDEWRNALLLHEKLRVPKGLRPGACAFAVPQTTFYIATVFWCVDADSLGSKAAEVFRYGANAELRIGTQIEAELPAVACEYDARAALRIKSALLDAERNRELLTRKLWPKLDCGVLALREQDVQVRFALEDELPDDVVIHAYVTGLMPEQDVVR